MHLYDRALLNRAALQACGITKDTPNPTGGIIEKDENGEPTGLLIAAPNATILYSALAKGPKLSFEQQINSTQHFMRELNRFGLTGALDAGGGFQNYPEDYAVIDTLAKNNKLTIRISYNLFTQKPQKELADFERWATMVTPGHGTDFYKLNGAGEMLVYSAADFEDFRQPRPEMAGTMEHDLEKVVRLLVSRKWPFRLHATYNETINRALTVFEKVNKEVPFGNLHWFIDHAETITQENINRIKSLGGGISIQNRMAFQGEYFIERYGKKAAENTPPIKMIVNSGIPIAAGTDATRVASYNPWISLYWLVTGKTVGGTALYPQENLLSRQEALQLWTIATTWFSNEKERGELKEGYCADFAVLSDDYFSIDDEKIKDITSLLTVVDGNIVHGSGRFSSHAPKLPEPLPEWSPVRFYGGYQSVR
jgi:predicted amidohydrolase YtcJ